VQAVLILIEPDTLPSFEIPIQTLYALLESAALETPRQGQIGSCLA